MKHLRILAGILKNVVGLLLAIIKKNLLPTVLVAVGLYICTDSNIHFY